MTHWFLESAVKSEERAIVTEEQCRNETNCRGCQKSKDLGLIVCWGCFKRHPKIPFKFWDGTFLDLLEAIDQ